MFLYIITDGRHYKIGITSTSVESRISGIQTGNPNKISLVKAYEDDRAPELERSLHAMFKQKRLNGEWFDFDETDLTMLKSFLGNFSKEHNPNPKIKVVRNFRLIENNKQPHRAFSDVPTYPKGFCQWCGIHLDGRGKGAKFCCDKHRYDYHNLKNPPNKSSRANHT